MDQPSVAHSNSPRASTLFPGALYMFLDVCNKFESQLFGKRNGIPTDSVTFYTEPPPMIQSSVSPTPPPAGTKLTERTQSQSLYGPRKRHVFLLQGGRRKTERLRPPNRDTENDTRRCAGGAVHQTPPQGTTNIYFCSSQVCFSPGNEEIVRRGISFGMCAHGLGWGDLAFSMAVQIQPACGRQRRVRYDYLSLLRALRSATQAEGGALV